MNFNPNFQLLCASCLTVALVACQSSNSSNNNSSPVDSVSFNKARFVDEYLLPSLSSFDGTTAGGFSGLDYSDGEYYLISDDNGSDSDSVLGSPRYYKANIQFDLNGISSVELTEQSALTGSAELSMQGDVDPESLRINPETGNVIWVTEGSINSEVAPAVYEQDAEGGLVRSFALPDYYTSLSDNTGPRHNAVFEGLSLGANGYWVAMEGPLKQDGDAPAFNNSGEAARVLFLNEDGEAQGKEFVIHLDAISRLPAQPGFQFSVNGVVEILEYAEEQFLLLERSYATNYQDGGNNVKLYKVDARNATDVAGTNSLSEINYTPAIKTLLFDFESIRGELTDFVIDNVEGMTFGPDFSNGSRSLLLVADDNFSAFGPQLNQFILLELPNTPAASPASFNIASLNFIGEQVLDANLEVDGTTVGGLSSIDYALGKYFLISDDVNSPRFYQAQLDFDANGFNSATIESAHKIEALDTDDGFIPDRTSDPEGLRVDPVSGNIVWVSEGQKGDSIDPSIKEMGLFGEVVRDFTLPESFKFADDAENKGPRSNLAFEGLSISYDNTGIWVAMEGPLTQDGAAPTLDAAEGEARISLFDRASGEMTHQFAYQLDSIVQREGAADNAFRVSGIVELLAIGDMEFLVMERSFTAGLSDGGNNVKIYKVDASNATDTSEQETLADNIVVADKTLLFDFETIRAQLTDGVVDNIEGITLGPKLATGENTLVVVADNNFNAFGAQLNQIIAFTINEE